MGVVRHPSGLPADLGSRRTARPVGYAAVRRCPTVSDAGRRRHPPRARLGRCTVGPLSPAGADTEHDEWRMTEFRFPPVLSIAAWEAEFDAPGAAPSGDGG